MNGKRSSFNTKCLIPNNFSGKINNNNLCVKLTIFLQMKFRLPNVMNQQEEKLQVASVVVYSVVKKYI